MDPGGQCPRAGAVAVSRENVEIVRSVYEAASRGDTAAVIDVYDPEVEYDFSQSPFASMFKRTVYRGHEGLSAFFRELYDEAWRDVVDDVEEIADAGQYVVTVVTSRGYGRASGVGVEKTHAGLWALRDGKVVRVAWFPSRAAAFKAAGLSG
jgi:ketosteroid isomerase-like protein